MAFSLPALAYPFSALEPHIDAMTMEIHHDRHHKAYVDNVNKALDGQTALQALSVEDLLRNIKTVPESIRQAVINNGGGHANHALFWTIMAPGGAASRPAPWPMRSVLHSEISRHFRRRSRKMLWVNSAAAGPGWYGTAARCR